MKFATIDPSIIVKKFGRLAEYDISEYQNPHSILIDPIFYDFDDRLR